MSFATIPTSATGSVIARAILAAATDMKIAINVCFGGFSISIVAAEWMAEHGDTQAKAELEKFKQEGQWYGFGYVHGHEVIGYERHNPLLIQAIEALGDKADGDLAALKIIEIPDGTDYEIAEYDGMEHIAEKHRTWA